MLFSKIKTVTQIIISIINTILQRSLFSFLSILLFGESIGLNIKIINTEIKKAILKPQPGTIILVISTPAKIDKIEKKVHCNSVLA